MFISCSQCSVLLIGHSSARLHDYKTVRKKNSRWGILSGGRIQLAVDLEKICMTTNNVQF